jgi:hypothetical protein
MNRNSYVPAVQDNIYKKRYYLTLQFTEIERTDTDIYINVKRGDRLDLISLYYYETTSDWWVLALANQLGKGSLMIPKAMQLRIPINTKDINNKMQKINQRKN